MIDLSGKCFFCEQSVGEESYCYGCGFSICNSCDFGQPVGMHKPNDHLVNEVYACPQVKEVSNETHQRRKA